MEGLAGIIFLLSGLTNGADFSIGVGFPEKQDLFIAPIGIVEASTPLYQNGDLTIGMHLTHMSSIPDAKDNNWNTFPGDYDPYTSNINMVSFKATMKFRR